MSDHAPESDGDRLARLLLENVQDYAIYMVDPQGRVRSWSPGAERLKGWKASEVLGRDFSIFYPPEAVAAGHPRRELAAAARQGRYEEEGWRLRKDGSRFWASVILTAIRGEGGELVGFAKVTRDLTERQRAEEDRLRLAQANEAIRLREQFLSIASHELRTPLTALQLYLQSILTASERGRDPLPAAAFAKLEKAVGQAQRLSGLVEALLDSSRVADGQLGLVSDRVNLGELARAVIDKFGEQNAARLALAVSGGGVEVAGDSMRLEQVLTNLLSNALKYGGEAPVDVTVAREGGRVRLRVADRGIGIAPEDQERIFGRFERAVSERNYSGLGLGLWIARELVTAMGGTIGVASEPGKGSTFTVDLPAA